MLCFSDAMLFEMKTKGQTVVLGYAESVTLNCEFKAEPFNLFDNPVLWIKRQHREEVQINMMGNLLEPFASTKRLRVSFVTQSNDDHKLSLQISGIL